MHRALLATALTLCASPALADAVTYSGTIGKAQIVVEFTAPPQSAKAPFGGRYFYAKKGIDIPLDSVKVSGGKLELAEEKPCTEDTCVQGDDGMVKKPPLGAKWSLTASRDGKTISGKWTENGRSQPVELTYVGSRPLPEDSEISPMGLAAITTAFIYGDQHIAKDTAPYDYLRMDVAKDKSDVTSWDGSSFQYLTDPRTKFPFPTIVSLAGGADATAANAYLLDRHWSLNADALNCEAQHYAGLGWFPSMDYAGPLGDYPDEGIEVTFLSPTLMSWTEGGSTYCGGAHPNNHLDYYNLDVKTGQPLDLTAVLKGWIARDFDGNIVDDQADARTHPHDFQWGPDQALADLVRSHFKDADIDQSDEDCSYDDLLNTNLQVSFKQPDHVLFSIGELDYAIQACGADIFEAPVADLKDYVAPGAADYFPSLRN